MLEPSPLQPTCGNCCHWGCLADVGMHRKCLEQGNVREAGERVRAMWEGCPRWETFRRAVPQPSVLGAGTWAPDDLFGGDALV